MSFARKLQSRTSKRTNGPDGGGGGGGGSFPRQLSPRSTGSPRGAPEASTAPEASVLRKVLDSVLSVFGGKKEADASTSVPKVQLDVPHRTQVGGTCGLTALGMVMDLWHKKNDKNANPSDADLLKRAQEKGWSTTGGIWEKDNASLATDQGYVATFREGASLDDIRKSIDAGVPPLVTFSVDEVGNPKEGQDRGHWAVVKGYFTKDGKDYIVAQHGWPDAKEKVWEASAFEKSWNSYNGRRMVTVRPFGVGDGAGGGGSNSW